MKIGCGKPGGKGEKCSETPEKNTEKKWCEVCKSSTHQTENCHKKNHAAKSVSCDSGSKDDNVHDEDNKSFVFKVGISDLPNDTKVNSLLVDCGATDIQCMISLSL